MLPLMGCILLANDIMICLDATEILRFQNLMDFAGKCPFKLILGSFDGL